MTHRCHRRSYGLQPRPFAAGRDLRAAGRCGGGTSLGTFRTALTAAVSGSAWSSMKPASPSTQHAASNVPEVTVVWIQQGVDHRDRRAQLGRIWGDPVDSQRPHPAPRSSTGPQW